MMSMLMLYNKTTTTDNTFFCMYKLFHGVYNISRMEQGLYDITRRRGK